MTLICNVNVALSGVFVSYTIQIGGGLDLEFVTCNAEGRKKRYLTHPLAPA